MQPTRHQLELLLNGPLLGKPGSKYGGGWVTSPQKHFLENMKRAKRLQQSLHDLKSAPPIKTVADAKRLVNAQLSQLAQIFGPPVSRGPGPKVPGCHVRGGKWVRR